ncbi:hypothetical protein MIMGU_mgv1a009917mg [Erythranthe guttata]|uniref:Replication protein A C-terminal domain-containing protein n=1 Tax=Erythranthe guttata TaxID=4155 RepID=A0A022RC75_ERYGU|nr:hypothetical protein MIMGU_mgv1a009917mg [Erythranthe guttata]
MCKYAASRKSKISSNCVLSAPSFVFSSNVVMRSVSIAIRASGRIIHFFVHAIVSKSSKMMFESSQFDSQAGSGGGFFSSQNADSSRTSAKVKLVGMVFEKSARNTDASFVIDDGTGRIACHRWINDPQDTEEVEELMDGMYVRVHGHLKTFQAKKQVVVFAIRPVNDYNEIATHFLECIHAHCCNNKSQNNGSSAPAASTAVATQSGHQTVPSTQVSQEYNVDGLGSIDKMVLDYLQLPSSLTDERGVHRNEIAQKLKLSQEKIIETMEALETEGLVYSTIDEFHYKSTAS